MSSITLGLARRAKWSDFGQRLHDIYGHKVTPDSQSIINEGRRDR